MKIRVVLLLCLSLFLQTVFAGATVATPAVTGPKVKVTMRDNGYTLGDMIAMHAEFNLAKGLVFDPNSVPLKGPVNNWLDLREVSSTESKNADETSRISIDFTWQIFGTVEHAQTLKIPAIALQTLPPTTANTKPLTIIIPAQGFNLSPVLPPTITEKKHRPHAPPLRFDTCTPLILALLCLGLSLLFGGLYLWLMDKIVWWPRNPGSITQLARQLNKAGVAQQSAFSAEDLRAIHKALAASAGQSLYPNTLHHLFERAPYLVLEKPAITQFFNQTWQHFYASQHSKNAVNVQETLSWVKRAAMAERLYRALQAKKRVLKTNHVVLMGQR
jgi:mxaA protein